MNLLISKALFILLNSKVVSMDTTLLFNLAVLLSLKGGCILPSNSEKSWRCYYCSWLLKFFTKSLVGDLTHCFSVFLSLDKYSNGEMEMNALEGKFEKARFSELGRVCDDDRRKDRDQSFRF